MLQENTFKNNKEMHGEETDQKFKFKRFQFKEY